MRCESDLNRVEDSSNNIWSISRLQRPLPSHLFLDLSCTENQNLTSPIKNSTSLPSSILSSTSLLSDSINQISSTSRRSPLGQSDTSIHPISFGDAIDLDYSVDDSVDGKSTVTVSFLQRLAEQKRNEERRKEEQNLEHSEETSSGVSELSSIEELRSEEFRDRSRHSDDEKIDVEIISGRNQRWPFDRT